MSRKTLGGGPPVSISTLTDEQRDLQDAVIAFAQGELNDRIAERDHDAAFTREGWNKCAEFGIQALPVPREYGGAQASATTIAAVLEGLGYGCADNGLIFSLGAQMWACQTPIVRFGDEKQKRRYLPGLCDGSLIAANCVSEPESGSDAFSLSTTAGETDDGWVLRGSKTFVTNGPESDLFVLYATTDRSLGFAGLCAFIVERDTPGLTLGRPLSKMGLRSSPMSEVFLEDCHVGAEALLGERGGGMAAFETSMRWERGLILASAVGTMRRQLERCLEYARERVQFGKPIGSFQAVSHRIVDMRLRFETARLMLYQLAGLLDADRATALDAALTKLYLSECFVQTSLDAMQIHGGYGYMTEYGLEREVRDALGSRLYSGTSELQKTLVSRHLGL
jgi:alkylation response protein AidB-like acyl-CoA dehydrogenase